MKNFGLEICQCCRNHSTEQNLIKCKKSPEYVEYDGYCDNFEYNEIVITYDEYNSIKKIVDKVMEYANKHTTCWGINEYVWQDDEAQLDGINLFSELIGMLPSNIEDEKDD